MRIIIAFIIFFFSALSALFSQQKVSSQKQVQQSGKSAYPLPIIDMHMHANKADFAGPPPIPYCVHVDEWSVSTTGKEWLETLMKDTSCKQLIMSQKTDEDVMNKTFEIMRRCNVFAVDSGVMTEKWKFIEPDRTIPI